LGNKWTKEELSKLISLYKEGKTLYQIAKELNRTYDSVHNKLGTLGVKRERLDKWKPEEIELLRKLHSEGSTPKQIHKYLPQKTYNAITNKLKDFEKYYSLDQRILLALQETTEPISLKTLSENLGVDNQLIRETIKSLITKGYDIKEIISGEEELFSLIRYVKWEEEDFYRILGEIELPFICSADYHIGSHGFSIQAFDQLIKDIEEHAIKDLLIVGDIIQGRYVYRQELMDLSEPEIQKQMDRSVELLKQLKTVKIHIVLGSHEEKVKGSYLVGLDPLRVISQRLSNCSYYGSVCKLSIKKTDQNLVMFHGSGGLTYARSYKPERLFRSLVERPNLLVLGHYHQLTLLPMGKGHHIIQSGTLQRENAYLIWKGYYPQIGYIIIEDFTGETLKVTIREPKIY